MPNSDNYLREENFQEFLQEIFNTLVGQKVINFFDLDENADDKLRQKILSEGLQELAQESALSRISRLREIIISIEDWYNDEVTRFMKHSAKEQGIADLQRWMKSQKEESWILSKVQSHFSYLKMLENDYLESAMKLKSMLDENDDFWTVTANVVMGGVKGWLNPEYAITEGVKALMGQDDVSKKNNATVDDFFKVFDKLCECIDLLNESIVELVFKKGWNQEISLFSTRLDEYNLYN